MFLRMETEVATCSTTNRSVEMASSYFQLPLNIDRVCRICLTENANLVSIFSENQDGNIPELPRKIQLCGTIEIEEQDGLPSLICEVCIYKANLAYDFRQSCQHSDTKLRLLYNKPIKCKISENSTQTDPQTRITLTKSSQNSQQSDYFVKEEAQSLNAQMSEVYRGESIVPDLVMPEEKMFICNMGFDGVPKNDGLENVVVCQDDKVAESEGAVDYLNGEGECSTPPKRTSARKTKILQPQVDYSDEEDFFDQGGDNFNVEEKRFRCKVCGKQYATQKGLKKHALVHEKKHRCEICSKMFYKEENLEKHRKTHENDASGKKYRHLPLRDKIQIINLVNEGQHVPNVASHFGVTRQSIGYIMKMREQILAREKLLREQNGDTSRTKIQGVESSRLEQNIFQWWLEQRNRGISISGTEIRAKALWFNSQLGGSSKFVASAGWLTKFKQRHRVKELSFDRNTIDFVDVANYKSCPEKSIKFDGEIEVQKPEDVDDDEDCDKQPALYKCEMCGQCCSTLKNLKRHSLIHGEKKYSCTVCQKWFFRPDTLKKHAEKHGHGLLDNIDDDNKLYDSDDDPFPSAPEPEVVKKEESEEETATGEYKCQHCDKSKSRKSWERNVMKQAIIAVRKNVMSLRQASIMFKLPKTTLSRYVKHPENDVERLVNLPMGRKKVLPCEVEDDLVKWSIIMQNSSGLTMNDLGKMAFRLAMHSNVTHPFCRVKKTAGRKWLRSFLQRHPELSLSKANRKRGIVLDPHLLIESIEIKQEIETDSDY